jgi:sugar phosphate isomerase/epimerase
MGPLTRRDFFSTSGRHLTATGLGLRTLEAAKPSKGALTVGTRDVHLKLTGAEDCWAALRALGAEGVEATIGEDLGFPVLFHPGGNYTAATEAGIQRLKTDMRASGRRITALCMYNRFDERPEFEIEWGTKAARAAQALGAKAIRIDVWPHRIGRGQQMTDAIRAEFLDFSVSTLKKLLQATDTTGVAFGIENHGHTTNDPDFLVPLFERVGSKRLGLTLDTANFYWYGHPLSRLYELYAAFAPHACHTHCKSISYPEAEREKRRPQGWEYARYNCPVDKGDIDFPRLVRILREAGYSNDLCVEDESLGKVPESERAAVLKREIDFLKALA